MPIQKWSEQIWVVTLADEPELSEELNSLATRMPELTPPPHLVLDLSGVAHINSSNLSQMLRVRKACIETGCNLRVVACQQHVWATILTTGLDKVFEFAEDVPNALASLQIREANPDHGPVY